MKTLLIIIFMSVNLLSVDKPQLLLESIVQYAISVGDGKASREYVFIDPMCKHSKRYVKLIMEDTTLQQENSYLLFLYRLDKYDSDDLIHYIYQSKDKNLALKEVMIDEVELELFDLDVSEKTLKDLEQIAKVAKSLNVERRPQMFTFYNLQE